MILFKYTTIKAMKAIIQCASLLVRPPSGFNDPFESVSMMTEEAAQEITDRLLNNSDFLRRVSQDSHLNPDNLTVPQLRIHLRNPRTRSTLIRTLFRSSRLSAIDFALSMQEWIGDKAGIVCFTRDPGNPVMWSHYADLHRGVVFAIDTSTWLPETIVEVKYDKQRILLPPKPGSDDFKRLLRTKYIDWQYEQEYRVFCPVDTWHGIERERVDYLTLQPRQIKWICAGVRTPDPDITTIRSLLKDSLFEDAEVGQARLHPTEFRVSLPDKFYTMSNFGKTP